MTTGRAAFTITLFLTLMVTTPGVYAQSQGPESTVQKSIQTPSVASLGEYGDIPVNLYTGIPNISILLHNVENSVAGLPVSISYHASGIRVDDKAGIAGLGWSLNAGGVITRTVQGFPDDKFNSVSGTNNVENTYSENRQYAWKTVEKILSSYTFDKNPPDLLYLINQPVITGEAISKYEYDTKPDIFSFNVAGKTGKFVLPNNFHETASGELPLIPYQNLKIRYEKEAGKTTLAKFEIIDADGTTYTFDEVEETSVRSAYYYETAGYKWVSDPNEFEKYNSSWFLTKIESPVSNEVIHFEYISHNEERKTPAFASILESEGGENSLTASKQQFLFTSFLLRKIITEKETVEFSYNNTDPLQGVELSNKTLRDVMIKLADGTEVKKWELSYDYFESENDTESGDLYAVPREAKLTAVQEMAPAGGGSVPPYVFEYRNNSSQRLPMNFDIYGYDDAYWERYFDNAAVDYWGYYNGKTANNGMNDYDTKRLRIPDLGSRIFDTPGFDWIYVNMEPDEDSILNGLISRIIYPTGGFTEFDFEIHDYSWVGDNNLYDLLPESDINPNPVYQVGNTKDNGSVTFEVEENSVGHIHFSVRLHNPSQPEENEGYGSVIIERVSPAPEVITSMGAAVEPGQISASVSDSLELPAGVYQITNNLSLGSPDIYGLTSYLTFSEPAEVSSANQDFEMFTVAQVANQLGETGPRIVPDLVDYRNKTGGGVRVKRITSYSDADDPDPVKRRFKYQETVSDGPISDRSSGVLVRPTQFLKQSRLCETDLDYCMLVQRIESNSFLPLGTTHGSNIGYREVTELLGENGEFGKVRHIYSSPVEVPDPFKQVYDRKFLMKNDVIFSQDWARGKEIATEHYNASGQLTYVSKREYELDVLMDQSNMYPGIELRSFITRYPVKCANGQDVCIKNEKRFFATVTVNTTGHANVIKETNTFFSETGDTETETIKEYSYLKPVPEISLPLEITETNSDNTKRITRYRYAHEVADDGTGTDYRPMLNLNIFSRPYSVTVVDSQDEVLQKRWSLWSDGTGFWRPGSVWEWKEGDDTNPVFDQQN